MKKQKVNFHIAQLLRNNTIQPLKVADNIPLSTAYKLADKRTNLKGMVLSASVIFEADKPSLRSRKESALKHGLVIADIHRRFTSKLFGN